MKELGELRENKNKEVEIILFVVTNLEQRENGLIRLEFAAEQIRRHM